MTASTSAADGQGDQNGPGVSHEEVTAASIAELFNAHNRALVGYLTARLRSPEEAKEVAQEAYVRLLQLDNPGTSSLLRAYLFKTAGNLAIDRLRRRHQLQRIESTELFQELNTPADRCDPERSLLDEELQQELRRCLSELPARHQHIFRMHRLEGVSQELVAQREGCSARMVRRYVTYVLVYCRLRLSGMGASEAQERVGL